MHLRTGFVALILATFVAANTAAAFVAVNQVRVEGTAEEFEVFARAGRKAGPDMFCAAADFADRSLGARATDRLVVIRTLSSSPTNPKRNSMSFRLSSAGVGQERDGQGLTLTAKRSLGQTRSVGHAVMFCWNDRG